MRAVLVGCGGISRTWLNSIRRMPDLEVVGLVDIMEEAASERAREFGLEEALVETDLERALRELSPEVVFDCTLPEAHAEVTLTSLAHGCHVLGEKPLAESMESARRVVEAAERSGRIYAVMQNRRHHPYIRRLRSFVESGGTGAMTTVASDFYIGAHFGGFRDRMEHVLLLDMAIHTFDAARFITGADPVSVYCHEWNPRGSWYDHDASAVAVFEMTGGVVYTYRGSWCAEGLNTSWESEWRVIGENGSVMWDGAEEFRAEVVAERGGFHSEWREVEVPPEGESGKTGGHATLIGDFVRCIGEGERPETICTDNIRSLAMVFGAIESAEGGRRVRVEW